MLLLADLLNLQAHSILFVKYMIQAYCSNRFVVAPMESKIKEIAEHTTPQTSIWLFDYMEHMFLKIAGSSLPILQVAIDYIEKLHLFILFGNCGGLRSTTGFTILKG